jgi:hypothetical protein
MRAENIAENNLYCKHSFFGLGRFIIPLNRDLSEAGSLGYLVISGGHRKGERVPCRLSYPGLTVVQSPEAGDKLCLGLACHGGQGK